jgi:RNA polymerase sigma-70 factor
MAAQETELFSLVGHLAETAETQWPGFRVERSLFEQRLLAVVSEQDGDPAVTLNKLHVGDLYLAQGCELGIPAALSAFASTYLSTVDLYLEHFKNAAVCSDDVRRELEDTLLFGRRTPPGRIGQYRGNGPLKNFVATAARNAALTMLRTRGRHMVNDFDDLASQVSAPFEGTESIAAARDEGVVRDAVRSALLGLDRRQRTIVRLHLVRGVTFTKIARMLKVHQSTVSRSFDAALHTLYRAIRRELHELHGMSESEMQSIIHDVRGRLELTWSRISCEMPSRSVGEPSHDAPPPRRA